MAALSQKSSQPRFLQALWPLAWLLLAVLIFLGVFRLTFAGLRYTDAMDYAQLGRHLSQGDGFVTSFVRPLSLAFFPQVSGHPELLRAPGFPLLLALLFGAFSANDLVVVIASALAYFGLLAITYLLARRMFNHRVAALSLLLLAVNLQMITYGMSGLPTALITLLLILTCYLLYTSPGSWQRSLAAGFAAGGVLLTDYAAWPLLVPLALFTWVNGPGRGWLRLGGLAAGFALLAVPWGVRNWLVAGSPFFGLGRYSLQMFSDSNPSYTLYQTINAHPQGPLGFLISHPGDVVRKAANGAKVIYDLAPSLFGMAVLPFFVAGMFHRFSERRVGMLRVCLYLMIVLQAGSMALGKNGGDELMPVVPLVTILAAAFMVHLAEARWPWVGFQRMALGVMVILSALPTGLAMVAGQGSENPSLNNYQYLDRTLPKGAAVATDVPWAVAWYAHRDAVWLPLQQNQLEWVGKRGDLRAVFLSALTPRYPRWDGMIEWQRLYFSGQAPQGFIRAGAFPPGDLVFLRPPAGLRPHDRGPIRPRP